MKRILVRRLHILVGRGGGEVGPQARGIFFLKATDRRRFHNCNNCKRAPQRLRPEARGQREEEVQQDDAGVHEQAGRGDGVSTDADLIQRMSVLKKLGFGGFYYICFSEELIIFWQFTFNFELEFCCAYSQNRRFWT